MRLLKASRLLLAASLAFWPSRANPQAGAPSKVPLDEHIPASNADLEGIKADVERYQTIGQNCEQLKCPEMDCAQAQAALQALSDLEANLRAMVGHLQDANAAQMNHFKALAEQGIVNSEQLARTILALGVQEYLHKLGSALLDIASVASTINDFLTGEAPSDPTEFIEALDKVYEAVKDTESAATSLAGSLSGEEIKGPVGELTPDALGLSKDTINDAKSTLSDAISIAKEIKEAGGGVKGVKEAFKKPGGPGAAVGQIIGRYLKAYSDTQIKERQQAIADLNRDIAASDRTQAASFKELQRVQNRRFAAEDALSAVIAARQAFEGCVSKADCLVTVSVPNVPDFTETKAGARLPNTGQALRHFNEILPGLAARLRPLPEVRDKIPCEEKQPTESFLGGLDGMGLDYDSSQWCTFGGAFVPLLPGGNLWADPLGPAGPGGFPRMADSPLFPGGPSIPGAPGFPGIPTVPGMPVIPRIGQGGLPVSPGGPRTTTPGRTAIPVTPGLPGGPRTTSGPPTPATPPGDTPQTTEKPPDGRKEPPPTFKLVVKAKQTVLEGGMPRTAAVPGAQLSLNLFPEPALPGDMATRDEKTGADQPPTKVTTGPNGEATVPFMGSPQLLDGPPPTLEIDLTPQTSTILSLNPGPNPLMGLPNQLRPFLTNAFMLDGSPMAVLQYPVFQSGNIQNLIGQSPGIQWSEPNFCREIQASPNDPYFRSRSSWKQPYDDQWAIKRVGFTEAPGAAWDLVAKASPVVVAVIDTGIDWNHEDIPWDRLWTNPGEIAGNGKDDDKNGYVDDVIGWDFWRGTNKPWDRNGHGTFVAGVIAAQSGNGAGMAGINPRARIMVLKALNNFGHTRASYIAQAIVYAADNGAKVINVSIGGKQRTRTEQIAIAYAHRKGAVIVVASGNEGTSTAEFGPGGVDEVVTVAATDVADKRAAYSNWGDHVDVAAPGNDVLGPRARFTDLMLGIPGVKYVAGEAYVGANRRYYRASGTSFAAPIVAGVASLLRGLNPSLTNREVKRIIQNSARDIDVPGVDQNTGYGLLDAVAALKASPGFFIEAAISGVNVVQKEGKPYVRITGTADADALKGAWIEIGAGESPADWKRVGAIGSPVRGGTLAEVDAQLFRSSKKWTLRLVAEHQNGQRREARFVLTLG